MREACIKVHDARQAVTAATGCGWAVGKTAQGASEASSNRDRGTPRKLLQISHTLKRNRCVAALVSLAFRSGVMTSRGQRGTAQLTSPVTRPLTFERIPEV